MDQNGVLQGALESKSLFKDKYPKRVGVGGKFVFSGHYLSSRVHNRPPLGVSRFNGVRIVKVKPKFLFVANKMSQNCLNTLVEKHVFFNLSLLTNIVERCQNSNYLS